ncbi:MAG: hypothetical protein ACI841_001336, partial [Planctomycetota bacterium]
MSSSESAAKRRARFAMLMPSQRVDSTREQPLHD